MDSQDRSKGDSLRKRAEKILSQRPQDVRKIPVEDIKRLIHELDVYQIELDMQNDELRKAQAEIEQSRAKYVDLYDFAPVGYFTLTAKGKIEEVNLTGAKLLGVERTNLVNRDFRLLIVPESTSLFESHRLEVLASDSVRKCELKLIRKDGTQLYVSLESLSVKSGDGSASSGDETSAQSSLIRSAMSDITTEDRCRYLSSQLISAQEAERHRIAVDLHDAIGHGLINMKHQMEPLLTWRRKEGPETEAKRFEILCSILDNTISEVRRIQQNLRPSMLDDLGLLVTIGWLCREFGEAHSGIRIDQDINIKEKEIPPSLKLVIFRILQETLSNVAKHTKASRVRLSLNKASRGIELTISDNGQGFDMKTTPRHGLGLVSMRERTELSNGTFAIESVKGKGTTIRVTWEP